MIRIGMVGDSITADSDRDNYSPASSQQPTVRRPNKGIESCLYFICLPLKGMPRPRQPPWKCTAHKPEAQAKEVVPR